MSAGRFPLAAAAADRRDALWVETIPPLATGLDLPRMAGVASLATALSAGAPLRDLLSEVEAEDQDAAARLMDLSILAQLAFQQAEAQQLQAAALELSTLYRVRSGPGRRPGLRLLAVMAPGDLMVNTPLDFITAHLDVTLTLLFVVPGQPLPPVLPEHDLAFFAPSEATPGCGARLHRLFRTWPRPALNDPALLPGLERARLARLLAGLPGILCPETREVPRDHLCEISRHIGSIEALWPDATWPVLVRPVGSHAGTALEKLGSPDGLRAYLAGSTAESFYLSRFVDYAGADGLCRKYRVAFIQGEPFLCHMAVSAHWMVHYLNAGMLESAEKRREEAEAMAEFRSGFALRHAAAFRRITATLGFDYYSIDCAETPEGALLVFEADTAAIIHLMDPVEIFPYKHPQMRRTFAAFGAMLEGRAAPAPARSADAARPAMAAGGVRRRA